MDMLKMIFYGFASYEFSFPVFFLKLQCLLYLKDGKKKSAGVPSTKGAMANGLRYFPG